MSLVEAVETDNEKLVKYLIKNGRSILTEDKKRDGITPFEAACLHGNPSIMEMFLKAAGTSIPANDLELCVNVASQEGHEKVIKLLFQEQNRRKLNPNLRNALMNASSRGHVSIVKQIIPELNDGKTTLGIALLIASKNGQEEIVDELLNAGADINYEDFAGTTALIVASKEGHAEVVQKLLQSGADITQEDYEKRTAWWFAIMSGNARTVKAFLDTKQLETQKKEAGLTAASLKGYENIVKILLDDGVNINTPTLDGWTPLSVACEENKIEIVEILIQAGADVNVKGENGKTPLQIAREKGFAKIEKTLLQAGAK